MKKVWINFLSILTCWEYVSTDTSNDFYTAAVVEYPLPTAPDSSVTNINNMIEHTLNEYLSLIDEAGENKADIITFPEGCINYVGIATRKLLIKHAIELNNEDIYNSTNFNNNCDYSKKSSIISKVSLESRKNGIYVLINVIERVKSSAVAKNKYNLYSTNIVFDRNGCIVSRYRKYNTKYDPLLNKTEIAEVQVFFTDFGVTFGHFTSLDIMSKYPAHILVQYGIKHVLYPTFWYSSSPFYTSLQLQQGFSYSNDIVLLAAGANHPVSGQGGSGIYAGRNGPLVMFQPAERMKQLMLSKVPKDHNLYSIQIDSNHNVVKRYNLKEMDQFFISMVPIHHTSPLLNNEYQKVCKNKICCEIFVKYMQFEIPSSKFGYSYQFSAHSYANKKQETHHNEKLNSNEMHCAIVACTQASSAKHCGSRFFPSDNVIPSVKFSEIRLSMIIELNENGEEDFSVMPTNVDFRLLPFRIDAFTFTASEIFNENDKQYRRYTTTLDAEMDTILTFGILGRTFRLTEFHTDDLISEGNNIWWYLLSSMTVGLVFIYIIWRLCKIK